MVYEDTTEMAPSAIVPPPTDSDSAILIEKSDRPDIKEYSKVSHKLDHLEYTSRLVLTPLKKLQETVYKNVSNQRALMMTGCNVVLILTLICLTSSSKPSHDCILTPHKQLLEQCEPFKQVKTIKVRFARNSSYHCYNTKTCLDVVDAEINEDNFVPNFIIGLHGFVYVGNGFQCASQNSTLLIEMSADSLTDVTADDSINMVKLREVVYEGLRCGKIHKDFQLSVTSGLDLYLNEHCHERLSDGLKVEDLKYRVVDRHRKPWTDNTRQGQMFNLLDKRRVYNRNYRIFACEESKNEYLKP